MTEDLEPQLPVNGYMPIDVAVNLMAQGYDLNALEGYSPLDPLLDTHE